VLKQRTLVRAPKAVETYFDDTISGTITTSNTMWNPSAKGKLYQTSSTDKESSHDLLQKRKYPAKVSSSRSVAAQTRNRPPRLILRIGKKVGLQWDDALGDLRRNHTIKMINSHAIIKIITTINKPMDTKRWSQPKGMMRRWRHFLPTYDNAFR
jgi:hypothetical protein